MGEISIQQAVLTGSIKSSENLTCEIVPEGGVSGKIVSPILFMKSVLKHQQQEINLA